MLQAAGVSSTPTGSQQPTRQISKRMSHFRCGLQPSRRVSFVARPTIFNECPKGIVRTSLASLWYMVVAVPDAQTTIHREICAKNYPWYAPKRIGHLLRGFVQLITMPLSIFFTITGKQNAANIASLAVLANPPSLLILSLLAYELSMSLASAFRAGISRITGTPPLPNDTPKLPPSEDS